MISFCGGPVDVLEAEPEIQRPEVRVGGAIEVIAPSVKPTSVVRSSRAR